MSRQLMVSLAGIAFLALVGTVIARQMLRIETLQARVSALEERVADIGKLKRLPVDSGR